MRDGGFCQSIPGGRGASLVGRYLHRGTSLPCVWVCNGACLWVWLLGWPTVFLPELHEAVTCLQWFQCVSLDRECGGQAAWLCRIKSFRERWQESTSFEKKKKKKKSWIKKNGKEIALLAAKEIVCQNYYFLAESISAGFLHPSPHPHHPLPYHCPFPPPSSSSTSSSITQVWIVRGLWGSLRDVLLWKGPGTAR